MPDEHASRVTVSHRDELSDWGRMQIDAGRFRNYLRRVLDSVAVGDEFEEFVDVGCCGDTLDIPFRVEAVEGPGRVGSDTEIAFEEREAPIDGGWAVQSEGTPEADSD